MCSISYTPHHFIGFFPCLRDGRCGMRFVQSAHEQAKTCRLNLHKSYTRILHPILHPKSFENTIGFAYGCRKCRRFSKTFFVEEREAVVRKQQNIGLLWAKLRMFGFKSTDVSIKEVRCFCIPERRFHNLNVSLSERRGQTCGLCWARKTKAKCQRCFPWVLHGA